MGIVVLELWGIIGLIKNLTKDYKKKEFLINCELKVEFHDYYINLDNSKYGLKERWIKKNVEFSPKLELKILLKTKDKAEL